MFTDGTILEMQLPLICEGNETIGRSPSFRMRMQLPLICEGNETKRGSAYQSDQMQLPLICEGNETCVTCCITLV